MIITGIICLAKEMGQQKPFKNKLYKYSSSVPRKYIPLTFVHSFS